MGYTAETQWQKFYPFLRFLQTFSKVTKKTEYQSSNLYLIRSFSRNYQFILKIPMDFTNFDDIKQVRKS